MHFRSFEELLSAAKELNPAKHEGFVVRDTFFNRVKVKAPQYVALSHLSIKGKVSVNAKHMLQIVRTNEASEFLAYFPEFSQLHQLVQEAYNKVVGNLCQIVKGNDQIRSDNLHQLLLFARELPPGSEANEIKEFLKSFDDTERLYSLLNLKFMEDPIATGPINADQALKNKKMMKQKLKAETKLQKKQAQSTS